MTIREDLDCSENALEDSDYPPDEPSESAIRRWYADMDAAMKGGEEFF